MDGNTAPDDIKAQYDVSFLIKPQIALLELWAKLSVFV